MEIINIHQAKTQLSALIQKVLNGEQVIIANNNHPVVELKIYQPKKKRGGFGALKGKIVVKGDWTKSDKEVENLILESDLTSDD